jgi:hypothetical protein
MGEPPHFFFGVAMQDQRRSRPCRRRGKKRSQLSYGWLGSKGCFDFLTVKLAWLAVQRRIDDVKGWDCGLRSGGGFLRTLPSLKAKQFLIGEDFVEAAIGDHLLRLPVGRFLSRLLFEEAGVDPA